MHSIEETHALLTASQQSLADLVAFSCLDYSASGSSAVPGPKLAYFGEQKQI